MTRQKQKPD